MIYCNDNSNEAAAWLIVLSLEGHLPKLHIDNRSITETSINSAAPQQPHAPPKTPPRTRGLGADRNQAHPRAETRIRESCSGSRADTYKVAVESCGLATIRSHSWSTLAEWYILPFPNRTLLRAHPALNPQTASAFRMPAGIGPCIMSRPKPIAGLANSQPAFLFVSRCADRFTARNAPHRAYNSRRRIQHASTEARHASSSRSL